MHCISRLSISTLLGFIAFALVLSAKAHDTWFVPGSEFTSYYLNTGSHFPQLGGPVPFSRVGNSGCSNLGGELMEIVKQGTSSEFIVSISEKDLSNQTICWASLKRRFITLNPREVKQYLLETKADGQWQEFYENLQSQGKKWVESYRKSARIEFTSELSDSIVDLPFQARLASSSTNQSVKANEAITLQVLLDKEPLTGQPVELLVDSAPIGVWYQTDEKGMIEVVPPVAGQALLRGTHFSTKDGLIRTEFLTYTFPVAE